jgi:hypothetical protein
MVNKMLFTPKRLLSLAGGKGKQDKQKNSHNIIYIIYAFYVFLCTYILILFLFTIF